MDDINFNNTNFIQWNWIHLCLFFKSCFNPFTKYARRSFMLELCSFYAKKNDFKSRKTTMDTINLLGIIKIYYSFGLIHIVLRRPNNMIGMRGDNLRAFVEHLKKNWKYKLFPVFGVNPNLCAGDKMEFVKRELSKILREFFLPIVDGRE